MPNLPKFCVMNSTAEKEGTQDAVRIRRNHFVVNKPVSSMQIFEQKSPSAIEMLKNLAALEKVPGKTSTADGSPDGSASKPLLINSDVKIDANKLRLWDIARDSSRNSNLGVPVSNNLQGPENALIDLTENANDMSFGEMFSSLPVKKPKVDLKDNTNVTQEGTPKSKSNKAVKKYNPTVTPLPEVTREDVMAFLELDGNVSDNVSDASTLTCTSDCCKKKVPNSPCDCCKKKVPGSPCEKKVPGSPCDCCGKRSPPLPVKLRMVLLLRFFRHIRLRKKCASHP